MFVNRFEVKLMAWLAWPWDDAFWPDNRRAGMRQKWREEIGTLFGIQWDDRLLAQLDAEIEKNEGFADHWKSGPNLFAGNPIFKHPLSGDEILLGTVDPDDLRATALRFAAGVANQSFDAEKRLRILWEFAADRLAEQDRDGFGPKWRLAPAYDFAPCFTVWQRQALASALAGAGSKRALLSFRIGGVQQFIDRARTTEDYWAGSFLISYLTEAASKAVEKLGPDVFLFPSIKALPAAGAPLRKFGTFPNGFLAIVPDGKEGEDIANAAASQCERTWQTIAETVRTALAKANVVTPEFDRAWNRQIQRPETFEIFWSLTPWNHSAYRTQWSRASRDMDGRKNLRNFTQMSGEDGFKCHQCGIRQAMLGDDIGFWDKMPKLAGKLSNRFRPKERLCAICIVRRIAVRADALPQHEIPFDSTSKIAVGPFLDSLNRNLLLVTREFDALATKLNKILPSLRLEPVMFPNDVQASWWYPEMYDLKRIKDEFSSDPDPLEVEAARKALTDFFEALDKHKLPRPSNYLAVVMADGDHIGDWIRGGELPGWRHILHDELMDDVPERQASPLSHLALSECLANVQTIASKTEAFGDKLIYCGGDDLLAFAPLSDLPRRMHEFRQRFSSAHDQYRLLPSHKITLSAAALIVHHYHPLSGAIRSVFEVLKKHAKEGYSRDAGVITIERQSGQRTVAGGKWRFGAGEVSSAGEEEFLTFMRLHELVEALTTDVSPRFISQVGQFRRALEKITDSDALLRLYQQLVPMQESPGGKDPRALGMGQYLVHFSSAKWAKEPARWEELEKLLLCARFLARKGAA